MNNKDFKYKLSINMIIKNEEENLYRCLDSLKELQEHICMEIVIADTGSTDSSKEIAKKYTDKVLDYKWNDNFSDARNFVIEHSKGEWILVLDADEELYDAKELISLLKSKELISHDSVKVMHLDVADSSKNTYAYTSILRMFRNNGTIKYINKFHETPDKYENLLNHRKAILKHYGYDQAANNLLEEKSKRNLKAMLEIYNESKDSTDSRALSKIADAYGIIGDWQNTLIFLKLAAKKSLEESNVNRYLQTIHSIIGTYFNLKLYDDCIATEAEYLRFKENLHIGELTADISVAYFVMCSYINKKDYTKVISSSLKYLQLVKKYKLNPEVFFALTGKEGNQTTDYHIHICKLNLAHAYYILKNYEEAALYVQDDVHDYFYKNKIENIAGKIKLELSIICDCKKYKLLDRFFDNIFMQDLNSINHTELFMQGKKESEFFTKFISKAHELKDHLYEKYSEERYELARIYISMLDILYLSYNDEEEDIISNKLKIDMNNFAKIKNIYPLALSLAFKHNVSPMPIFKALENDEANKIINYCIKNDSEFEYHFYNYLEDDTNIEEIAQLENISYLLLEKNINSSYAHLIYNLNALAYFSELLIQLDCRSSSIEDIVFEEVADDLKSNYVLFAAVNELRKTEYQSCVDILSYLAEDENFNFIGKLIKSNLILENNNKSQYELKTNIINSIFMNNADTAYEILLEYIKIYGENKDEDIIFMKKIFNIRGE